MSLKNNRLNELIDEQQALLNSLKAEASAINSDELTKENEQLKLRLDEISKNEANLKAENEGLKKSLDATKSALFTKLANEKLSVFSSTQKRLEKTYYKKELGIGSKLNEYEKNCLDSIDATVKVIEGYSDNEFNDILNQLNTLREEAQQRRVRLEEYKNEQINNAKQTNFTIGDRLKDEPLTDAEKRTALKQKSLESFIGLNVLGKAGILLFIVGIIMLGRFAYVHMSDVFKGGVIYLLGIVLIGIGEIFYKKEKTVFSTTLISGGVATLYAAAATCYFAFDLYNVKVTFIICVLITAIAVAISNQVKSQVVCAFGAVGGYLPVVALYMIGFGKAMADVTFLPVSSVYFCLLAIILFAMTYNKRWYVAQFIGYALHLLAIGGVAKCAYSVRNLTGYGYALPLAVVFAIASFVIFLMMPGSKIVRRKPMQALDTVLLALNTLSGAISVSITAHNCFVQPDVANRIVGYVFIAFTAIYVLLSVFSVKEKKADSYVVSAITCISALVFSMFIIPLIFGREYAGIAWALEGLLLALIAMEKGFVVPELAGLICMLMSAGAGYMFASGSTEQIALITFCVILSAFWIYSVRGLSSNPSEKAMSVVYMMIEIASAIATMFFVEYLYNCIADSPYITASSGFFHCAVIVAAGLCLATAVRFGVLKNDVSMIVSDLSSVVLFFAVFGSLDIHSSYEDLFTYFGEYIDSKPMIIVNIALLVVLNIGAELLLAASALDIINRLKAPTWLFTMVISVSSLMLITATIMSQFDVKFSNVIISALYIAVACLMLFLGFKNQHTVVRSGGLVLILCAFAKLCFVDTAHLDSGWKIASYFAFGAILIAVSYFYQRFSKKLEADMLNITEQENSIKTE